MDKKIYNALESLIGFLDISQEQNELTIEQEKHLAIVEKWFGSQKGNLLCPICDVHSLEYRDMEKGEAPVGEMYCQKVVRAYFCSECPCIVYEYWDDSDTEYLKKLIE